MLDGEEVVVSCAGCYRTLSRDYRERGYNIAVKHISQLIEELMAEGRIEFEKTDLKVTYHDPCHLSRHSDERDTSRAILMELTDFREMEHHGRDSRCCGAGGGCVQPNLMYRLLWHLHGYKRLQGPGQTSCAPPVHSAASTSEQDP
ncbi:heterodisulfide reductase HdrD related protein [Methanothermobacter thermautotrophicus str. Delta H]|uniref:Heterodisulfide reductase HdrD related protein n=1 Tax=Methanothermobacter thermautotrophicus (strain ATCC 29096 / DSM 1053 / JCM 10044 / NBRC 100330 / Delta H) TaxID=187420 RepID=O26242_METTH|nr:heterodisulfide reductase HdrD related protein [Methanothermobacter thermautotrophicus str. Delta H]